MTARVLLAGYGLAGSAFHAPVIEAAGLDVAGIVTRDPARRAAATARFPHARLHDTFEPEGYDCTVVASPNRSHAELALASIAAGVPVVVDKPFANSLAAAEEVVAASEAAGVPVTVFQNRRWDGDFLTLRRLVDDGSLGTITRYESRFERWRPAVDTSRWRESAEPEDAGGVLTDLGTHLVDQAIQLFGQPTHVYAELARRRPGAAVDDDAFVALTFPSGVQAHLWMSMTCAVEGPRFRVQGTVAGFESYGLDPQEDALRSGMRPGGPGWDDALGGRTALVAGEPFDIDPGRYTDFYAAVAAALAGDGAWPVDPHDALATQRVIDAARRSAGERPPA